MPIEMVYKSLPARAGTVLDALTQRVRRALPLQCLACGEPGDDGLDLCSACHDALPRRFACEITGPRPAEPRGSKKMKPSSL